VVLGVDGGNTKTEVVAASLDGEPLAFVRGGGSNSHGPGGSEGCVAVVAELVERTRVRTPVEHGVFFLCGADIPADIAELEAAVAARGLARNVLVDNDTFAVLRAGTDTPDAVAVVCGAGMNCVGRAADGRVARYPSLGWETGDWGGGDALGREALFVAARAEDGRDRTETALADIVRTHFGLATVQAVGEAVHYRRLPATRLGELAPEVVTAAAAGDEGARPLVERLAREIGLVAERAFRDLELAEADVVFGGGMFRGGGFLYDEAVGRLPAGARPLRLGAPPVLGAALAALDAAGAPDDAGARLRAAFRDGLAPDG
jgi:N-acetylglucosamine kinase-like BadF-type ATPase